jgi:hypothetical protein
MGTGHGTLGGDRCGEVLGDAKGEDVAAVHNGLGAGSGGGVRMALCKGLRISLTTLLSQLFCPINHQPLVAATIAGFNTVENPYAKTC